MKNSLNIICVLAITCLLTACGNSKKLSIYELIFNEEVTRAYYEGNPYTGSAWSVDGKTLCLECENGDVKHVTVYHSNGSVAIDNNSLIGEGNCFDKDGKSITKAEFVKQYPELIQILEVIVENMMCSPELK